MLYRCRRRVCGHHGYGYHVCGYLGRWYHYDDDGPRVHPYGHGRVYGPLDGHHGGGHELLDCHGCELQVVVVGP